MNMLTRSMLVVSLLASSAIFAMEENKKVVRENNQYDTIPNIARHSQILQRNQGVFTLNPQIKPIIKIGQKELTEQEQSEIEQALCKIVITTQAKDSVARGTVTQDVSTVLNLVQLLETIDRHREDELVERYTPQVLKKKKPEIEKETLTKQSVFKRHIGKTVFTTMVASSLGTWALLKYGPEKIEWSSIVDFLSKKATNQ